MKNNDMLRDPQNINAKQSKNKLLRLLQQAQDNYYDQIQPLSQHMHLSDHTNQSQKTSSQLSSLLKTNKILISNKRNIHENKIKVLEQRMKKINKLIETTYDSGERKQLLDKLKATQSKKIESQLKLQKLNNMEIEMMEVQSKKQNIVQNTQRKDIEEWRIVQAHPVHKQNLQMSEVSLSCNQSIFGKTHLNVRSRCVSMHHDVHQKKKEDEDRQLLKTVDLVNKQTLSMSSAWQKKRHSVAIKGKEKCDEKQNDSDEASIYDDLNDKFSRSENKSYCCKSSEKYPIVNLRGTKKSQNSQSYREGNKQSIFQEEVSSKKIKVNEFMMKNCQQEHQKQRQQLMIYENSMKKFVTQIRQFTKNIGYEDHATTLVSDITNTIEQNRNASHHILPSIFSQIISLFIRIGQEQGYSRSKIIESNNQANAMKRQLENQLQKIITKQRQLLEEIDELSALKQELSDNIVNYCDKYAEQFNQIKNRAVMNESEGCINYEMRASPFQDVDRSTRSAYEQFPQVRCSLQAYSANFESMIQACHLKMLQLAQKKLSAEYKLSNLSIQETDHRKALDELKKTLNTEYETLKQYSKQIQNLRKQNSKHESTKNILKNQIQELEDLYQIRKQNTLELEQRYNSIKTKKIKNEKILKNLSEQISGKEHSLSILEEKCKEKQSYLETQLLLQVKNLEKEKEELRKFNQNSSLEIEEKRETLKGVKKRVDEQQKKLHGIQRDKQRSQKQLEAIKSQLQELNNKMESIKKSVEEKQKYLIEELTIKQKQMKGEIKQTQKQLKELEQKLQQQRKQFCDLQTIFSQKEDILRQLTSKIKISQQKNNALDHQCEELSAAKQQLQDILGQVLHKKQKMLQQIQQKNDLLNDINQNLEAMKSQSREYLKQINHKEKEYQTLIIKIEQKQEQIAIINQQIKAAEKRLSVLYQTIQEHSDEEQSLQERIDALKELQARLIVSVSIRKQQKGGKQVVGMKEMRGVNLNEKIREVMSSIQQNTGLRQKLAKEKQQNRRLRLDNERLTKLSQIDDQIIE